MPLEQSMSLAAVRRTEQFLLALCMWREARGEGASGMLAVGCVIWNRKKLWGGSIWQVVTARNQFTAMTFLGDRQTIKWPSPFDNLWQEALVIADSLLDAKIGDPTGGALYYFNPKLAQPKWAEKMRKLATIGNHDFYAP